MKKSFYALLALFPLFLSGCGGNSGPTGSVEKYYRAVEAGMFDEANALIAAESQNRYGKESGATKAVEDRINQHSLSKWRLKTVTPMLESVNGDSAHVEVQITYGTDFIDEDRLEMSNDGSGWLIVNSELLDKLLKE